MAEPWRNKLYFGDNLRILREHIADESVDLIYLDPPFNSKADYNVLYKTSSGEANAAQATAFKDTWEWDEAAAGAYHELMTRVEVPTNLKNLMQALKVFLTGDTGKKGNSMMAYLTMMALRLVELHRVLKPTGSMYLHCDPTASHYIKMVTDAVYGFANYQNELIWKRTVPKSDYQQGAKNWPRVHDVLLHYAKDINRLATYHQQFGEYDQEYIDSSYPFIEEGTGRRYGTHSLTAPGAGSRGHPKYEFLGVTRYWRYSKAKMEQLHAEGRVLQSAPGNVPRYKRYLDEMKGVPIGDIWTDVKMLQGQSAERLGYPTQKPESLLERIIQASSNEGDVVLDPFCGCGTTVAVAERLNRRWIGIDVTYLAVDLMERRLLDSFTPGHDVTHLSTIAVPKRRLALKKYWENGEDVLGIGLRTGLKPYEVIGDPKSGDDAKFLFENDPYQFEWWAIGMVGAQGKEYKKGADRGIDGIITFQDKVGEYERAVVSVKGGKVGSAMLRDLQGTMKRENAVIGVLITNEPPTSAMRKEAADAGRWTSELFPDRSFPVIQILTAEDLLNNKDPDLPRWGMDNFKKAVKVKAKVEQKAMFEDE